MAPRKMILFFDVHNCILQEAVQNRKNELHHEENLLDVERDFVTAMDDMSRLVQTILARCPHQIRPRTEAETITAVTVNVTPCRGTTVERLTAKSRNDSLRRALQQASTLWCIMITLNN